MKKFTKVNNFTLLLNLTKVKLEKNEGFTMDSSITNVVSYKNGFQCSFCDGIITKSIFKAYHFILKNKANGVWCENSVFYIDFSKRFEKFEEAIDFGKKYNQISIFDWATKDLIYLNQI